MDDDKDDEANKLLFRLLPLVVRACANPMSGKPTLAPDEWIELDEILTPLSPGIRAMADFWRDVKQRREGGIRAMDNFWRRVTPYNG